MDFIIPQHHINKLKMCFIELGLLDLELYNSKFNKNIINSIIGYIQQEPCKNIHYNKITNKCRNYFNCEERICDLCEYECTQCEYMFCNKCIEFCNYCSTIYCKNCSEIQKNIDYCGICYYDVLVYLKKK